MKFGLTFLLLFTTTCLFAQLSNEALSKGGNDSPDWTSLDFKKNHVHKVEEYVYRIRKGGKLAKDSILVLRQELGKDSNKVVGRGSNALFQSRGHQRNGFSFETLYDANGHIRENITVTDAAVTKSRHGQNLVWDSSFTLYTDSHDVHGNLTFQRSQVWINGYTVFGYTNDTFQVSHVRDNINEYLYNETGQMQAYYTYANDSTGYKDTRSRESDTSYCSICMPRYLVSTCIYHPNGKLNVWIRYTPEGKVTVKRYYYYDGHDSLVKEIDSLDGYYAGQASVLVYTTMYEYSDSGRVVTTDNNSMVPLIGEDMEMTGSVVRFNNKGQVVTECYNNGAKRDCIAYFYKYENGQLISTIRTDGANSRLEIRYRYNSIGLLAEEKTLYEGKIASLRRYFYQ